MKKSSSLDSINSILQETLGKLEKSFKVYPLWKQWRNIVGDKIADVTEPAYTQNEKLIIFVKNHIWLQELSYQKDFLLEKVRQVDESIEILILKIKKEV